MFGLLITPLFQTFAAACDKTTFLGLVPWYQYLNLSADATGRCAVTNFNPSATGDQTGAFGAHSPGLLIGLAVLDDLIRVAAMVAVGYIVYGGIQYMTSQGSPDMTKKAQQTIINALIGLGVALMGSAIVAFVGNQLGDK